MTIDPTELGCPFPPGISSLPQDIQLLSVWDLVCHVKLAAVVVPMLLLFMLFSHCGCASRCLIARLEFMEDLCVHMGIARATCIPPSFGRYLPFSAPWPNFF